MFSSVKSFNIMIYYQVLRLIYHGPQKSFISLFGNLLFYKPVSSGYPIVYKLKLIKLKKPI
jgi:hypothetical protein